jgi:ABC-type sulfate/molybdate transport systems ATPase subunit
VQLDRLVDRFPSQLRAAPAHQVFGTRPAAEPKVPLHDEPLRTSTPGAQGTAPLAALVNDGPERTSIFVTHVQEEALKWPTDRVVLMNKGKIE